MTLNPEIVELEEKKCVGICIEMSISKNETHGLWKSFRPRVSEISNRIGKDFISLQEYPENYFHAFDPNAVFTKWALVEVENFDSIPEGIEKYNLKTGRYAVFHYRGPGNDPTIFQKIYGDWLPNSEFELDYLPHFEVLGSKYNPMSADSEEEIWIPIK